MHQQFVLILLSRLFGALRFFLCALRLLTVLVGGLRPVLKRFIIRVCLVKGRLERLFVILQVARSVERVLRISRHLIIIPTIAISLSILCWCVDPINLVCSVPSVEVLLSVGVETTITIPVGILSSKSLLGDEVCILLAMEA